MSELGHEARSCETNTIAKRVLAEVVEELDHLRLHRDVEGRGGLVGDHRRGLRCERHGDEHALTLNDREFVRVRRERALGVETDSRSRSSALRVPPREVSCFICERMMSIAGFSELSASW